MFKKMAERKSIIPSKCGGDEVGVIGSLLPKGGCLALVDELGKVKAIPIFSKDTELLVFRTVVPYRKEDREEMSKELTEKIGIKCVVIDVRTELVAVYRDWETDRKSVV